MKELLALASLEFSAAYSRVKICIHLGRSNLLILILRFIQYSSQSLLHRFNLSLSAPGDIS